MAGVIVKSVIIPGLVNKFEASEIFIF